MKMSSKPAVTHPVAPARDAYGWEMWNCYKGISDFEIVERDDGFVDFGSARTYFQEHDKWPFHEREAIAQARGTVLDIGCGAGRVALYLQARGHQVVAIDKSPLVVKVAKRRGVKKAHVLSIDDIPTLRERFDTIVMYGNNFGLFGGMSKARRLLREMQAATNPHAIILASATDPYATRDPVHRAYHQRNRERGRMAGQIRLRIRYRQYRGDWFDYLLASQDEVRDIVAPTSWTLREVVPSPGPGYVAILAKG